MGLGHFLKGAMNGLTGQPDADQEAKDQAFIQSLLGQTYVPDAAGMRAPPASGPHARGQQPVEGPSLPEGMSEPDPSVGPTDTGLPGGGPYNPTYLDEGVNGLVDAKKQAAAQLFEDPAKTLNVLIEARKRGAGPGVNGILEFMVKENQRAMAAKDKDKTAQARFKQEDARNSRKIHLEEAKMRLQEKLANAANATRVKVASMHGKRGPLDESDLRTMSPDELDALDAELQQEAGQVAAPDKSHYDAYDNLSMQQFREDYKDFSDTKMAIDKVQRALDRVRTLKKNGGPATSPPASSPNPSGNSGATGGGKVIDANTVAKYIAAAKQQNPSADKQTLAAMARQMAARDGYAVGQ